MKICLMSKLVGVRIVLMDEAPPRFLVPKTGWDIRNVSRELTLWRKRAGQSEVLPWQ